MTFGSLFAGIGGMDLGLERAGMQCRWQVEIDPYARRVLERHWPDVRRWDDVRTFPPDVADAASAGLPALAVEREQPSGERATDPIDTRGWFVDLIAGGFPCQDISFAGKGAGLAGERSGLWYEFARIVGVLAPRVVLIENVSALLVRGLDQVLGSLASLGYDAEWACLPAAAVGAPHIRDRVFIVGYASGEHCQGRRAPGQQGQAGLAIGPSKTLAHAAGDGRQQWRAEPAGLVGEPALAGGRGELARFRETVGLSQWGADPADDPESGVGRVAHGVPHRVDRLRGLGNAVVPQVAELIGRCIIAADRAATDGLGGEAE